MSIPWTFQWDKARPARKAWKPNRHLWADCLDNVGSSTAHNPMGLHGLLKGIALILLMLTASYIGDLKQLSNWYDFLVTMENISVARLLMEESIMFRLLPWIYQLLQSTKWRLLLQQACLESKLVLWVPVCWMQKEAEEIWRIPVPLGRHS
jgi:hypothetical protein